MTLTLPLTTVDACHKIYSDEIVNMVFICNPVNKKRDLKASKILLHCKYMKSVVSGDGLEYLVVRSGSTAKAEVACESGIHNTNEECRR
jgi:hypothetical protein